MQSVLAANQVGKSSGYRVMPTCLIPSPRETLSTCRSTVRPVDPRLTTLKVQPE